MPEDVTSGIARWALTDVIDCLAWGVVDTTMRVAGEHRSVTDEDRTQLVDRALVACLDPDVRESDVKWRARAQARIVVELTDLVAGPTRVEAAPGTPLSSTHRFEEIVSVGPILVVEDSATAAAMTEHALRSAGVRNPILTVPTLAAAGAALEEGVRPALVVLDYELPDGTGLQLLRSEQHRARLAGAPVIVMSAHETSNEIDESHELGVVAYLIKPVAFDAVSEFVRHLPAAWYIAGGGPADGTVEDTPA